MRQPALTPRQVNHPRVLPLRFHALHRRADGDQHEQGEGGKEQRQAYLKAVESHGTSIIQPAAGR